MTGEIVALRPDITPQVARLVATRLADVGGPVRLCYEGAVARLTTGARGQREILQAGVELYGAGSPEGDAEAVSLAAAALAAAALPEVRLEVGHVALARHALAAIAGEEQRAAVALALLRKDKAGVVRAAAGLPRALRLLLEALPGLYGEPRAVLGEARALRLPGAVRRAVDSLEEVLDSLDEVALPLAVDLGEVRGFDYYTGIRLAGFVPGAGDAVLAGGRYDELAARYGRPVRAVGFAIDVEAIAEAQSAAGVPMPARAEGVLVAAPRARRREAGKLAAALRAAGSRAAVDLGPLRGRRAVIDYAVRAGFSRVIELGPRGAFWIEEGGAVRPIAPGPLRRAVAGDVAGISEVA